MVSFTISKNSIDLAHYLVNDLDIVTCGFFVLEDYTSELFLFIDKIGDKKCKYTNTTPIIFHTRSSEKQAYPDSDDLSGPDLSILFTKWGLWEINGIIQKEYDIKGTNGDAKKIKEILGSNESIFFTPWKSLKKSYTLKTNVDYP